MIIECEYCGTVNKFDGDGALKCFACGAPLRKREMLDTTLRSLYGSYPIPFKLVCEELGFDYNKINDGIADDDEFIKI